MVYPLAPETKRYPLLLFIPASRGNFSHMKGQGILPRLSDFPGETGKCRGKFLHMNRPLDTKKILRSVAFLDLLFLQSDEPLSELFFDPAEARRERLKRYTVDVENQDNFESEKLWAKVTEAIKAQDQVRNNPFTMLIRLVGFGINSTWPMFTSKFFCVLLKARFENFRSWKHRELDNC